MLLRRFFPSLAGLCVLTSTAHAQTTAPPTITPAPFDAPGTVQVAPNDTKKRAFKLILRNVSPSLMAFWLDPENHPAPPGASTTSPIKSLKIKGMDLIVPIDLQKTLLVFGTPQAFAQLQTIINILDMPQEVVSPPPAITLSPSTLKKPVTFALSVYWIDSLTPDKESFQQSAPHVAKEDELNWLANLMEQDRATDVPLPTQTGVTSTKTILPLSRIPGSRRSYPFYSIEPDTSIDPGIYATPFDAPSSFQRNSLTVTPMSPGNNGWLMIVDGAGVRPVLLSLKEDDTILFFGSSKDWKLKPPSARFDSFVLMVQPRIQDTILLTP